MIGSAPFPVSLNDLTTEVLSRALGVEILDFEAEPLGLDRGMLCELFLLDLRYGDAAHGPPRVVAKFSSSRELVRSRALAVGIYERELRFFDVLANRTPMRLPDVYASWYDTKSAEFLLLLEAIEADVEVDQLNGIDAGRAKLVIREMASLHAKWAGDLEIEGLEWLPTLGSPGRRRSLGDHVRNGWNPLAEMIGPGSDPKISVAGELLERRLDEALANSRGCLATLIHLDLRLDNLLFSPDGTTVTVIDWQGVGVGPASWDLAYFISQSLTIENRRNHEKELLDLYADVVRTLQPGLDPVELMVGYEEAMWYGLTIAAALMVVGDMDEPRTRLLAETMALRALAALDDHGQLEAELP